MPSLLPFFIVLFAALFFSGIFNRLNLPWVVALILSGVLVGPQALGWLEVDTTLDFIGDIGLVFLMFMAGLETRFSTIRKIYKKVASFSILNSFIPATAGFLVGIYFGYDITASILLGVIFMSSSIAVVIPSLNSAGLMKKPLGQSIVAATVFEDVTSLIILSILIQSASPLSHIPLPLFYFLLFLVLVALRWIIIKIRWYFSMHSGDKRDLFESEFRLTFAVLIGTVIIFELLGLHPIVAGFFAGFVIAGSMQELSGQILKEKLHAISYGLFIPTFFILIGTKTDLSVFYGSNGALTLTIAIISISVASKFISGFVGGKTSGFSDTESALAGASTIPQLSTTLAVAFTGLELGLIDEKMVTSLVLLSIITTLISPILIQLLAKNIKEVDDINAETA